MERSSGNFDTAVFERAEVVQVRKQRTECRDFQKKTIERGFRSSWLRTSEVLLYMNQTRIFLLSYITAKRIELDSPGWSGFVANSTPDQT